MSTFIIESTNFKIMPTKMLYVVVRNLFKHGVKDTKIIKNQVHLYLNYHPKNSTVEEKLGMIPVRYLQVTADDEEELQLFFHALSEFPAVKKYLMEKKEEAVEEKQLREEGAADPKKKIKILENRLIKPATVLRESSVEEKEEEDDGQPLKKKNKKLNNFASQSSTTADYLEAFNPNDDFESQIVNVDDKGNLVCLNK